MPQYDTIRPVIWQDGMLALIDQRLLPQIHETRHLRTSAEVADAIRDMMVRGAPAIGISAAWGVVLAVSEAVAEVGDNWRQAVAVSVQRLADSRPTAVNLFWALDRMQRLIDGLAPGVDPIPALVTEAQAIQDEDVAANYAMGRFGAALIMENSRVLTHCNAGALATGGYGTALGVIRAAWAEGKLEHVYADETRPWLQGARLTAWEMVQEGIPVTLIADGASAWLMKQGQVDWLIVGSDRIVANGDVANKIGTYHAALAARQHGVKVMVVAPVSTIDMSLATGDLIPIEQRAESELLSLAGQAVAANGARAWNPSFDVTPATYVDVIVTEYGVVERPDAEKMAALMAGVPGS